MTLQRTYSPLTLRDALRRPAFLTFGALWLLSAVVVALRGELITVASLGAMLVVILLLSAVTVRLVPEVGAESTTRRRPWAECSILTTAILLMGALGYMLNTSGLPFGLKSWTLLIINPTVMVLLPGAALLLLGVRLHDLGLGRGRRSWLIGLLWSAPYLVWVLVGFLQTGSPGPGALATRAVNSLLMNGFSEEFLWRGAVQGLLARTLGSDWGLVLASLLFGVWHIGANLRSFPGDFLAAFAFGIVSQALLGLAFGVIYRRTGNLLAPTLLHVASHLPMG